MKLTTLIFAFYEICALTQLLNDVNCCIETSKHNTILTDRLIRRFSQLHTFNSGAFHPLTQTVVFITTNHMHI